MATPDGYRKVGTRINRFLSSIPAEAESLTFPQTLAGINIVGDYTGGGLGETDFYIKPDTGDIYAIERVLIRISDTANISSSEYLSTGALADGVKIRYKDDGGTTELLPFEIKEIADYGSYAGIDVRSLDSPSRSWVIRWSFFRSGAPVYLRSSDSDRLVITVTDNFSTLVKHTALVQGLVYYESNFKYP